MLFSLTVMEIISNTYLLISSKTFLEDDFFFVHRSVFKENCQAYSRLVTERLGFLSKKIGRNLTAAFKTASSFKIHQFQSSVTICCYYWMPTSTFLQE